MAREGSLFIGRLSKTTRTRDVEEVFEAYGRMTRCEVKYGKSNYLRLLPKIKQTIIDSMGVKLSLHVEQLPVPVEVFIILLLFCRC